MDRHHQLAESDGPEDHQSRCAGGRPPRCAHDARRQQEGARDEDPGWSLADRDPDTGRNRPPKLELVRLTIPRRVYTENHLLYVRDVLAKVYEKRDSIRGLRFTYEPPILRHFRARFEEI